MEKENDMLLQEIKKQKEFIINDDNEMQKVINFINKSKESYNRSVLLKIVEEKANLISENDKDLVLVQQTLNTKYSIQNQ